MFDQILTYFAPNPPDLLPTYFDLLFQYFGASGPLARPQLHFRLVCMYVLERNSIAIWTFPSGNLLFVQMAVQTGEELLANVFHKVRVNAVFLVFRDFGWVFGPLSLATRIGRISLRREEEMLVKRLT